MIKKKKNILSNLSTCQTQGPLPHTTADFWRMVVECEVQVIIMASNETEGGKVGVVA